MVVTSARSGQVMSLGGRPAAEVARDAILELEDPDRELVSNGLRLGLAMDEYRERFGAQDFLVREIVGVDEETGSLQIAERPSVGQTVQFLIRDPDSARNDLELALDKLSLDDTPPLGVLLCESKSRGNLEEDLTCLRSRMEGVPLAGMVCAGEFDRGTDRSVVHGASASAMIFRTKRR